MCLGYLLTQLAQVVPWSLPVLAVLVGLLNPLAPAVLAAQLTRSAPSDQASLLAPPDLLAPACPSCLAVHQNLVVPSIRPAQVSL